MGGGAEGGYRLDRFGQLNTVCVRSTTQHHQPAPSTYMSSWMYKYVVCVCGIFFFFSSFSHFYSPASSGQAVVTGVVPFPPRFLPFQFFIAHRRVQQSHCSSIFHRVLLTHALALSARQFVHKKKSQRNFRVCTRRGSNSRNLPIPSSRIT